MADNYTKNCTVFPSVVRADGRSVKITIHPLYEHIRKLLGSAVKIKVFRVDATNVCVIRTIDAVKPSPFTITENGDITVDVACELEGEYIIKVDHTKNDGTVAELTAFHIYALKDDLYCKLPFKGDFHMHSFCSDGYESPAYVAAGCRMHGMDFMALTDHKLYAPSLTAIEEMRKFNCDMLVLPGEEIHLNGCPAHLLNFGGSKSINEMAFSDEEKYRAEVQEYIKKLPYDYDDNTMFEIAAGEWVFDRIAECGGISLFCHPFWRPMRKGHIGDDLINAHLERGKFDALEVFGGFYVPDIEGNMLSMTRFYQEIANGKKYAPVGVSDAHGTDERLAGWYFTIVFAEKLDFESIKDAIKNSMCVAVQHLPGVYPLIAGSFRLVQFAYFLMREFYPMHDELCRVEGEIMRRALAENEPDAADLMAKRSGTVSHYINSFHGK